MKRFFEVITSITVVVAQCAFFPNLATANSCKDIKVIFVDGSGAQIGGTDNNYLDYRNAIDEVLKTTGLSYDFYELGTESHGGYKYPAAGIGIESLKDFLTTVGAYFSAGESYTYGASVSQGVGELYSYINETVAVCENTKFVIGGLSQGAGVISESLPLLDSEKIIYVSTFGDAKLYLPEGRGLYPEACRGKNLSPYRAYVPDCTAYQGILQGLKPYQPEKFRGKLGAWCNHHDVVCTSYINWLDINECTHPHGSYGNSYDSDHLYEDAASVVYRKVAEEFGLESGISSQPRQNVAILIDTTESMERVIEAYKSEAMRLASEVFQNGGAVALYEYRDLLDPFDARQLCNFETCTPAAFEAKISSLIVENGGDKLESVLPTVMKALNQLNWEQGAIKSIIVLTDAGYHMVEEYEGEMIDLEKVVKRSLEIDPVNIYTITPDAVKSAFVDLTEKTNGKSFSLTNELSFSTDFILERPDVKLNRENYVGGINEEFLFDASATISGTKIVKYEWDLDFDGIFETQTNVPYVTGVYTGITSGFIQVKATDQNGLFGTMSAKVNVEQNSNEPLATSEIISYETNEAGELEIEFETDAFRTVVVVNGVVIGTTNEEKITIGELDFKENNVITLIPYNKSGQAGEAGEIRIEKSEGGGFQEIKKSIIPTAPQCGRK